MLQNAMVTAFTVFELLRENQLVGQSPWGGGGGGGGGGVSKITPPPPPPRTYTHTQIRVKTYERKLIT